MNVPITFRKILGYVSALSETTNLTKNIRKSDTKKSACRLHRKSQIEFIQQGHLLVSD
jgi:hypothetical protein